LVCGTDVGVWSEEAERGVGAVEAGSIIEGLGHAHMSLQEGRLRILVR
jgi:hypothetical protein